jgi:hypothetical protein
LPAGRSASAAPTATPPTADVSAAAMVTAAPPSPSAATFAPSASPTAPRRTPRATATPATAADVDATATEDPDGLDDDASLGATSGSAVPTPNAPVRAFRTPGREEPPPFVAPAGEAPATDGAAPDASTDEPMPPPDQPYVATVTFRAAASTELDGFDLMIIYPRAAGDFVGHRNGVECRTTGDATLFADDHEDGMLQVLVASSRPLPFPFDVVCKFTVAPNASLTARLIAVNVEDVTIGGTHAETSALTVSILAH